MADLSQQLRLQQELNKVLSDRQKLLEGNNQLYSKQAKMVRTINESMSGTKLDNLREKLSGVKSGANEAAGSVQKLASSTKDMGNAAKDAADDVGSFSKKAVGVGAAIGAFKGLRVGIGLVGKALSGGLRLLGSFAKGVFNIGKAILSIPFKMFGALMEMGGSGGSPVFLQSLEKVRETFGDIATGSGLALRKSAYEIRSEFTKLTGTTDRFMGPTFGRVFGYGREGLAKALEFNAELATALGGSFASMRDGMKKNFAELAIYRKGLGLSADAMANFMKLNEYSGKDYMKGFEDLSNMAIQAGEAFGFSAKEVGKTVSEMLEDVENFGSFTAKELVNMSVQSKRLGVDLKALVGVTKGFDDFGSAIERSSNMFRMFNMRVDGMRLFAEEDPVKRIQMLQQSFKAAGNDITTMNRRQVQFLAEQANVDAKTARMLFSKKGLEMDYDATKRQTEKAQKKQLTTAQVLSKLSRQIERIFGGGGGKYKGFFDAFAKGFGKGVKRTREFRSVMRNINRSLRTTELFGRRVGRSFVRNFPGVKQFLGALADFFNPYKLIPALDKISKSFDKFFKALRPGNERKAFEQFASEAMDTLEKYFGGKGEAIELMKGAMTMIGEVMLNLKLIALQETAKVASEGLSAGTKILSAFLEANKDKTAEEIGGFYGSGIVDSIRNKFGENAGNLADTIVNDLVPAIVEAGPVIFDGFLFVFSKIGDFLERNQDKIVPPLVKAVTNLMKLKLKVLGKVATSGLMGPFFAMMLAGPAAIGFVAGGLKTALALGAGKLVGTGIGQKMAKTGLGKAIFGGLLGKKGLASKLGSAAACGADAMTDCLGTGLDKGMKPRGRIGKLFSKVGKWGKLAKIGGGLAAATIGAAISGALNASDVAEKSGESWGSAFAAGTVSAMTLGLADVSDVYGFFGNKVAQENLVLAKEAEDMARIMEGVKQKMKPQVDAIRELIGTATQDIAATGELAEQALANASGRLTARERQTLEGMTAASKASQDTVIRLEAELHKTEKHYTGLVTLAERIGEKVDASNSGWSMGWDSDIEVALEGMTTQQKDDLQSFLEKYASENGVFAKDLIKFNGQMATIHNDFFDDSEAEANKFRDALNKHFNDSFNTRVNTLEEQVKKAQRVFADKEQGLSMFATFKAAGDSEGMAAVREQMFKDMLEKEKEATTARAVEYMTKHGLYKPNTTGFTGARFQEQGKPTLEYLKEVNPSKYNQLMKEMNESANRLTNEALGTAADAATASVEEKRLQSLEAAAVTLDRIEKLGDVPARLRKAENKLKNVNVEKVQASAGKVFLLAAGIGKAIDAELQKNPSLIQQGATVSGHFNDVMESASRMGNAVTKVLDASKKIPSEDKLRARLGKFKTAFVEIATAMGAINSTTQAGTVLTPLALKTINSMETVVDGLVASVPDQLSKKITASSKAIKAAKKNVLEMKKITGSTDAKATIDLVKAISQGGRLEVVAKSETSPMQVTINLDVDSKELATAILKADLGKAVTNNATHRVAQASDLP